jgi:hypothetical protein
MPGRYRLLLLRNVNVQREPFTVKSVIVTAGQGFTDNAGEFHPWGQELKIAEGPELEQLLADEKVRIDDRMKGLFETQSEQK